MDEKAAAPAKKKSVGRMREWRERQRQRFGGLVPLSVWVRREHEGPLKRIFEDLADPDWRGEAYRATVTGWLWRHRPLAGKFEGLSTRSEIDQPLLDNGKSLKPIGGRVFGGDETLIELTPDEALDLDARIRSALDAVHEAFLRDRDLNGQIRDQTGVIVEEHASHLRGTSHLMRAHVVDRPVGKAEFWANERAIARAAISFKDGMLQNQRNGCFLLSYSGLNGFPSKCLIATSLEHPELRSRPSIALIQLQNSGTPPSMCYDRLATKIKATLMPDVSPKSVEWYEASRDVFSLDSGLHIHRVEMDFVAETYKDPAWNPDADANATFNRFVRRSLASYEDRKTIHPPENAELEESEYIDWDKA